MREPSKNEVAKAVIALMELDTYVLKGWNIPNETKKKIKSLIDDLKFQYQFQK